MRQQLEFLLMFFVLCKNGIVCDFITKDYLNSTPTENSVEYVTTTYINTNDINSTFGNTTYPNNDIEESSTPFSEKSSKYTVESTTTVTDTTFSMFSTSRMPYTQEICSAPKLSYTDLQISWETGPNEDNCTKTNILFNCIPMNNIDGGVNETYILADTTYVDLDKDSLRLEIGYQYNCTAEFTDNETVVVSDSTSLVVPPGSSKINVKADKLNVTWTAPFINQTLVYNVFIKLLRPNHYVPNECENGDGSMFNYTTNNTYFLINDYFPDYDYTVNVSTTFWNISNNDGCFITTPTAAPEAPANVSVQKYVNAKYEKEYSLHWRMPCHSNGKIQKYHVKITNADESNIVEDKDVLNSQNETECELNLRNLTRQSIFKYELYAIGENNERSESIIGNFTTEDNVLPAPVVSLIDKGSTYFTIEWTTPNISEGNPNIYTFHIDIENLGPRYPLTENCTIGNTGDHQVINNETSYNFTSAMPFYLYDVTVTVSSTEQIANNSGNLTVATISSVPDAPYNLTLNVNEHTLFSELSWDLPCNVNGNISNFNVVVSERYSEDNITVNRTYTKKSNEFMMNLQLQPSHIYIISVSISLEDGLEGKAAIEHYESPIGFPGKPILSISNVFNTSFVIEWLQPIEKTGPILSYELNITSLGPRYNVPTDCPTKNVPDVIEVIGVDSPTSYTHFTALPYNSYRVEIRANTSRGFGNFSTAECNTSEGVPETVRNINNIISNISTEEYDATVTITFDQPCHTYGIINDYSIEYHGIRKSFPDDHNKAVIKASDSKFIFRLQPEYNYTYDIWSSNALFKNAIEGSFNSPAGVPIFNASISIPIDSVSTENAEIVLKKEYFNLSNGNVRYIALLLGETKPPHKNFSKWNSKFWPTLEEGVHQLTDCYWNPFETSNNYTFDIGTGSHCNPICSCNMPLKDHTAYHLTIRVFTSNFYRDALTISFQTKELNQLATILGVLFGILFFAIVAVIGFYVWKKQLYRKLSFIYPKKLSAKPLATSSTAIVPKKFIQYFKNTQSKPEFLKEQFADLEEKSKEIIAQKSSHFSGLLENKRKNRYVNISPYDETRVKLLIDEDDEIGSDYINASYVKGCSGGVEYIATQGPLPTTCRDFWKMVVQENVTIIVMVAQFIEKEKEKCHKYFPKNHENLVISDDMEIRCSTELHFGTYLVRNLQVRKDSLQVNVTHMQFLEWPDFNVPTGTEHMLQFIYQIRERVRIEGGIVIVHCSAGVGRTGTLIAADMLLQNVNAGKQIDVFNTVLELRKQRVMMVQNAEQYVYLHRLVADHIDRPPTPDMNEGSDPVYENMDMIKDNSESQTNSKRKEEESEF